jgi:hypothetical protein
MSDPATAEWREAMGASTSAKLRQTQQDLAASQADLTATRGTVVDLLYIIDAFQIESGADRNASAQTGIEAVRRLRGERDEARAQAALYLAQRDDALHDRPAGPRRPQAQHRPRGRAHLDRPAGGPQLQDPLQPRHDRPGGRCAHHPRGDVRAVPARWAVIEPTEEMKAAVRAVLDDPWKGTTAVVAAVLAIVERDYVVLCGAVRPLDDSGYGAPTCNGRLGHDSDHRNVDGDSAVFW